MDVIKINPGFGWMAVIWFAVAVFSATLGLIHLIVWVRERTYRVHLIFALTAVSATALTLAEVWMFRTTTAEAYTLALRWFHVPAFLCFVSLVFFVRTYLQAGRVWLAWTICVTRFISLVLNFTTGENLNYLDGVTLRHLVLLGEHVAVATGRPNLFMIVGQISLLLLLVFMFDAAITTWRRGDHRRALYAGGALILLVFAGTLLPVLTFWDVLDFPLTVGPFFVGVLGVMAFALSGDIMDAIRFSAVIRDKESQVRFSEERLDLAANAANIGLWSVEPEHGAIWASERARRIYGVGREEPVDLQVLEAMIHGDDLPDFRTALSAAFESGDPFQKEYRIRRRDGATRWILARGRMIDAYDAPGARKSRRLVGASVDITERKASEARLAELAGQLERTSRITLLGELSGTIAHELNQPLAGILNTAQAADLARNAGVLEEAELKEVLDDIISDTKRAAAVIRNLRDLYKDREVEMTMVDMREVIESSRHLINSECVVRGVLSDYVYEREVQLLGNKLQLQQVLVNMLMNSVQAISRSSATERRITVRLEADEYLCRVVVEDSGDGIPPDKLAEIFSPLTSSRSGGMGLGLTICKRIIAMHGGNMQAENRPEGGARVVFMLPLPR